MLSYPDAACEVARHLCSHDEHGYSQPNRAAVGTGGSVGETLTLSDGTVVGIATGDRDCSSMSIEVYSCLGVGCGGATYTGNMRRCMVASGNFAWHTRADLGALLPGDLLLNEDLHTAVYLGDGMVANAGSSETGGVSGARGDQTGREVRVRTYFDSPWDGFLRYCGPKREVDDLTTEEHEMLKFMYDHMHWDEDTHFSGLGNLVVEQPIAYADRDESASLGERVRYIDAQTNSIMAELADIKAKLS